MSSGIQDVFAFPPSTSLSAFVLIVIASGFTKDGNVIDLISASQQGGRQKGIYGSSPPPPAHWLELGHTASFSIYKKNSKIVAFIT